MHKNVLITGAARGIGRAAATAFAAAGYGVAVNYVQSGDAAAQLVRTLSAQGARVIACRADVSDRSAVDAMFGQAEKALGEIHVLVNNAAIAQQKLFTDLTEADWEDMFAVNVRGVFHCCQRALPSMLHRKQGKIINISSMWGEVGASCETHYAASKAAVIGLTKSLAKELAPSHIQVNCIAPGAIDTDMNAGLSDSDRALLYSEIPLGAIGRPEDIAAAAVFLASPGADYITGQVLGVNGGMVI